MPTSAPSMYNYHHPQAPPNGAQSTTSNAHKVMFSVRLDSDETLEEFAQRVQFIATDAHPGAKEETIQQISVEVFLRGLPDKEAACSSSDKCSKTIQKASKYVKNVINTQKAIFNKPSIPHHQVSFVELDKPDLSVRSTS